ncbi:sensor protein PhoQ [Klebsiella pneumoniae]|uniref:Sensor protein PhoQ n=1 Tax=Klebsiella pneumoniae TaxID=573 RepID=A0A377WGA9_KLEPN|nr:sensor protein PhoQ [Klebsiella pneumoniae]
MPQLSIVVVDTIPVEPQAQLYGVELVCLLLAANLLLVIPLLWVAAWWSLRPIESLAKEVRELEEHHREKLQSQHHSRADPGWSATSTAWFAGDANAMTNTALPSPISLTV